MTTEVKKTEGIEEAAKIESVATPTETAAESSPAEPAKVKEVVGDAVPAPEPAEKTETAGEEPTKSEETPKEAEKPAESDTKERNGPLKVLANLKRNLSTPKKGDKKEESDTQKEDQPTSPSSKEKVLDKLVGRIFKKDECHCCKIAPVEDKPSNGEGEAATTETAVTAAEEPTTTAETPKPTEEKKEETKEDKSKGKELYGQIVKALTPHKASWKESKSSASEKAESPKAEVSEAEAISGGAAAVESESSDKAKKEGESEPSSPNMLIAIKNKATGLVQSLEEKIQKDKESKDKDETKGKAAEESKTEEKKTEQPVGEVTAPIATEEPAAAEAETTVEQEKVKKDAKKDVVGNFIDGVKSKIQDVLSKDQEAKDAPKANEEPAAVKASGEAEKVREAPQTNGEQKKEVLTVNELKYEDESKKKEKAADTEASTQEQTSQKWTKRVSGLFKVKKSPTEERAEPSASAPASAPAQASEAEAAPAATPKEAAETSEGTPAATSDGEAKDSALRLAQLYMQTPDAGEAAKEDKKVDEAAAVESAAKV